MRRTPKVAFAAFTALAATLLATPAVESAPMPRFRVSIEGTQRFEWSLDATRNSGGQPIPCAFKGSGRQLITFRTAKPVAVLVPPGTGTTFSYGGQPFRVGARRQRLVPLVGEETREYRALEPPNLRACPAFDSEFSGYGRDCRGTNRFLSGAGVVVMRYKPTRRHKQKTMMYAPVDVLLFPRSPQECDLRLFDLRNYLITQLMTITYLPLQGGDFERRTTTVVKAAGHARYCIDPSGSTESEADFQSCSRPVRPARGPSLTGTITTDWKITFRRAR